ncbi:E3 ubiquitin-protein ligase PUB23 [Cynara cardunculus var. scolymus]|uniref:U-box domain-containing protein n=1 Tax=Cynara cardunculus var. scolymus TaxID=59895 RepID=A0A103XGZ0_CYNCS|nr:E3 ubiquitin-protein ligase PUB23 [Cynara cardunculus var. scolymus]KVH90570.1 Armadillo-like helical [Cynara cardunculus var. scolymus]
MGDLENDVEVPPFFVCPISLEIMKDPVTLPTGITYDRDSIEKWLFAKKNNTCPVTKNVVLDADLTPNHTLRRLIQSWCTLNPLSGVERVPTPRLPITKPQILKLLKDLKYPNLQMKTLKRLKLIVLENETNKRSMEAVGAVDYLVNVINDQNNLTSSSPAGEYSDDDVERFGLATPADEALAVLYHMHLSQNGLQGLFAKGGDFVDTLTRVMQCATANYESRTFAVLLLKSMFDAAQHMPVRTSSLKPEFFTELVNILVDQISQKATKATLKLLINVCLWGRNRIRAAEAAAVPALIDILLDSTDKRVSEMVLLALDLLCQCAEGRSELLKHGAGLAVVSKRIFRISPVASDRAVRILHSVAKFSGNTSVVVEMLQLGVVGKLCLVLQVDCGSKMKEKAMEILKMHARVWNNSPCIPHNLISSYPS